MAPYVTLATCSLNQWALDFEGNRDRIIESIRQAKAAGSNLRVGPELETTGYSCQDHFLEGDTYLHSWEMLAQIIDHPECQDILLDLGAPVRHRNVRYNCRVIVLNRKVLLIRPKLFLADDGNYREGRWFTPWAKARYVEDYYLERIVGEITGQKTVPFGDAVLSTYDTCVGAETCEELFTPNNPGIHMGLNGVEIFTNSSGSHHELRKLRQRIDLIMHCTRAGGIYMYANQRGMDGDGRLYFDGSCGIFMNGRAIVMGKQFSLNDVEVVTCTVDLEEVRSFRTSISRSLQGSHAPPYQRIEVPISLGAGIHSKTKLTQPLEEVNYHIPSEEISLSAGAFLWDYLRRCGGGSSTGIAGFFLPLSGGLDSCSTALIVFSMCRIVHSAITKENNKQVIKDLRRLVAEPQDSTWLPATPQEISSRLFHTCYIGTTNSSSDTRGRAKQLAGDLGSYHLNIDMDSVVSAITRVFTLATSFTPRFTVHDGTGAENLALQNIQARSRMVLTYMFAQLLPLIRKRPNPGSLLVLGSGNLSEQLRGYYTKYDNSSADINPIGGIDKVDLVAFVRWSRDAFELPILDAFCEATPTAELEPITSSYVQSDEDQMGVTYADLGVMGRMRKIEKRGPWAMYENLLKTSVWADRYTPRQIYEKVRHFFYYYSINRHKQVVLTPALHSENYGCDDNRFDLRPILYPTFSWPFKKMEKHVEKLEKEAEGSHQKDE
ncbi:glutamine-dependent NAD(+) synthetase [Bisporella sp. PMI_857]|nr:glutamine-dependent NAD(+) synthetase [Bisporella sp. PMI_857]